MVGVALAGQPYQRHSYEVCITQVFRAICVCQFHGLGHVVDGVCGVVPPVADGVVLQNVEDLHDVSAAGGGRRHGVDIKSPIGAVDRLANGGFIVAQVFQSNQTLAPLHFRHNQPGGFSFIKAFYTLLGNALEGVGQFRLAKHFARLWGRSILFIEGCAGGWPAFKAVPGLLQAFGESVGYHKTLPGQSNSRGQGLAQAQGAVPLQCQRQPGYGAGYPGGLMAEPAALAHDIAVLILKHGFGGCSRCGFAIINGFRGIAVTGRVDQKAATANIAGTGLGDGQGEAGGNSGINGVAPVFQYLQGNLCGQGVAGGNHTLGALYRMEALPFQNGLFVGACVEGKQEKHQRGCRSPERSVADFRSGAVDHSVHGWIPRFWLSDRLS